MSRLVKFTSKNIGEFLTIIGAGITSYNIFNFSYSGGTGGEYLGGGRYQALQIFDGGRFQFEYVAYYYKDEILLYIALGVMLVVLGLIVIKKLKS